MTYRAEDIPDEWVALAIRANADRNHDDLCGCVTWPEQCASGYTPDQWEHGDEAHTIAAVTPEIQRQERERAADELFQRFQRMREEGEHDMRTALHHVRDVLRSAP